MHLLFFPSLQTGAVFEVAGSACGIVGSDVWMKLNMSIVMEDAISLQMFRNDCMVSVTVALSFEYVVIVYLGLARTFNVTQILSVW